MSSPEHASLEAQIDQWRDYLRRRDAIHGSDLAQLEDHLRSQVADLMAMGLDSDEAFLVALKRMGDLDALSREFAREHSERLWKHLAVVGSDADETAAHRRRDAIVAFGLAIAAAVLVKLPTLFGLDLDQDASFHARNLGFFVFPLLTGYFVWKRGLDAKRVRWLGVAFVVAGIFANAYPFSAGGSTEVLSALHLPITLWLVVGVAYTADRWRESAGRMDFIRFSGELFIYYVLIALGGGVLMGFTALIFQAIGVDLEPYLESWILPCGAAGGVLVASWLVEAKQGVMENMAPVLTRLFTPLFAIALLMFLGTMLLTGRGINIEREVLIAFDLLLAIVLALLIYSVSARNPQAPPGPFDVVQVVLLVSALAADALALLAIGARISEFGMTPNRVAALGENLVLLANLGWSVVLYVRFLRHSATFATIERWQTNYLPVYGAWAAVVAIVFPPLFAYR